MAETLCSFTDKQYSKIAPVKLLPFGDIVKIYFQESNKYAGLLNLPGISKLLEAFAVTLNATLISSDTQPRPKLDTKNNNRNRGHVCSVRIVVYGFICDKSAISDLLSSAGLYLQQPAATECDRGVEYYNPQYLLRPGAQMPVLEKYSIFSDIRDSGASETLEEAKKNRLMRIFDSTTDIGTSPQVISSPRLRSSLKQ